jgi:RNA polymerase primary sigma factor
LTHEPDELLTADEEKALARRIEAGSPDGDAAKERFIQANRRLVLSRADWFELKTGRRQPTDGMGFEDLVQEGMLGLMRAVDKFDWRRGFKFSTMAVPWIDQAVGRAVASKASLVYVPERVQEELWAARKDWSTTEEQDRQYNLLHPVSLEELVHFDDEDEGGGATMAADGFR